MNWLQDAVEIAGIIIIAIVIYSMVACASVNQQTTSGPAYQYRADMRLSFDGGNTVYDGTTSAKVPALGLPITFISPVNIDRVQVTTCARQHVCQSKGYCDSNFTINKDWTGAAENTFTYTYKPTPDEQAGLCPLYVEAYSKQALSSWGFIGFIGDESLPAQVYCNGKFVASKGLTVCQAFAGNENTLTFAAAPKYSAEKSCNISTTDNLTFTVKPSAGLCRATFVDTLKHWQRLIMIGYSSVLVRSN